MFVQEEEEERGEKERERERERERCYGGFKKRVVEHVVSRGAESRLIL